MTYHERMKPPFEKFKYPTCRGCIALGSACGVCEKCEWERSMYRREKGEQATQPTPQNAEADNIRPSVQAAVDKINQSKSGSDYKSEIIGDLTILHRDDPHSNAEVLEAQPLENEGDFATPLDCLDALLNIALYGNHAKDLKECAYREIATIRAALKAAPKNWLEAQLEEARKDYENWPDWKKKCSRTGEFIRNRDASKDGGE